MVSGLFCLGLAAVLSGVGATAWLLGRGILAPPGSLAVALGWTGGGVVVVVYTAWALSVGMR